MNWRQRMQLRKHKAEIAKEVAKMSGLDYATVALAIEAYKVVLREDVLKGKDVLLEGIGTFTYTVKTSDNRRYLINYQGAEGDTIEPYYNLKFVLLPQVKKIVRNLPVSEEDKIKLGLAENEDELQRDN